MATLIRDSDGHTIITNDAAKIERLKGLGFRVEGEDPAQTETQQTSTGDTSTTETAGEGSGSSEPSSISIQNYDDMTAAELRRLGETRGHNFGDRMSRQKMIETLRNG